MVNTDELTKKKEWTREDVLMMESKSLMHQMLHLPKNCACDICNGAKMYRAQHRKVPEELKWFPEKFGEWVMADHLVLRGEKDIDIDGKSAGLVIEDLGTNFLGFAGTYTREAEEACFDLKDCKCVQEFRITLCSPYGGRRISRASPPAAGPQPENCRP